MTLTCPICASHDFEPSGQSIILPEILSRWQKETGIMFSDAIWQEFSLSTPVIKLYHCSNCGFEMFNPPIIGNDQFYREIAIKDYYVPDKWEFLEGLHDLLQHHCQRVLDIGCGSGDFLGILKNNSIEGIGYELNSEVAELAREKGCTVIDGEFPGAILDHEDAKPFDAICMFQVLEHIADPVHFINSIRQLLRPGGILIIGVPDSDGPIRYYPDALTSIPPHHVSRWRKSVFQEGAQNLGIKILRVESEPLPDYLWNSYLPVLWDNNIWPAQYCQSVDPNGEMEKVDRILWFIDQMKSKGVRHLEGVPGHTLYLVIQFVLDPSNASVNQSAMNTEEKPNDTHFDSTNHHLMSGVIQQIGDWIQIQRTDWKIKIERREMALVQWQTQLDQRQAQLDQRQAQIDNLFIVRMYHWVKQMGQQIRGKK